MRLTISQEEMDDLMAEVDERLGLMCDDSGHVPSHVRTRAIDFVLAQRKIPSGYKDAYRKRIDLTYMQYRVA